MQPPTKGSFFWRVQTWVSMGVFITIGIVISTIFYAQYKQIHFKFQTQAVGSAGALAMHAESFLIDQNRDQLNDFLAVVLQKKRTLFTGIIQVDYDTPKIEVLKK